MKHKYELLKIISSQLNKERANIQISDFSKLVEFAKTQALLQYVSLFECGLQSKDKHNEKITTYLTNALLQESVCSENQLYEAERIQQACENAKICTLLVKGAVTKKRYMDPLFRTMSDIDLLYKSDQHKEFKALMFSLGYSDYNEGRKNDTYTMPPLISVEAHRSLVSNESLYYDYYQNIWNRCNLKSGCDYTYEMRLEDEFLYNIIHLAEHFKHGGAGVRFIIDVYVYDNLDFDRNYFEYELQKIGLFEFYKKISALSKYWFAEGEATELVIKLSDFVLSGSVFGNNENKASLSVSEGRLKFILSTCFPQYEDMKSMFLWLEGKRFLLPYAWFLRGVQSLKYRKNNVNAQIRNVKTGDSAKGKMLKAFYRECGLR